MSSPLLTTSGTFRPMMRLAMPVLVEHVMHALVQYVDLWLTGRFLGQASYLAAIALMGYVMWLIFNLFAFFAVGATAMTARFIGAGDGQQANRVMNQAMLSGGVWSVVLMAIGAALAHPFISLMQLEGQAAAAAVDYLFIILLILPALMAEEVGIACLRGAGDMVSGLVVMSVVNVVNIVVSAGLVVGIGPLPELGWRGLAIGTACGHGIGGLIVVWLLYRGRAGYHLRLPLLRPDWDLIRRLLRIGLPGGVDVIAVVLCHMWYVAIINSLGDVQAAAHGVGVRIEALAYMPGGAFQVAAATLVGQYLGAGDYRRATRSVLMACLVGGGIMTAAGVAFYFGANGLSQFFLGGTTSPVVPVSAGLLRIVAFSMPALALSMILGGALRGAGDTRWPLVFTFIGFLGFRIPLAYLLAYDTLYIPGAGWSIDAFNLDVYGAWYAMFADVVVRCLLIIWRFWHGGWKHVEI